jgi:hypothetical protein
MSFGAASGPRVAAVGTLELVHRALGTTGSPGARSAKFIAVGELLVRGVELHKTYSCRRGVDLSAAGPTGTLMTKQVKFWIQPNMLFTVANVGAGWLDLVV